MMRVRHFAVLFAATALVFVSAALPFALEARAQTSALSSGESPEAFVHRLFDLYKKAPPQEKVLAGFLDPGFAHLMKENAELFGAEGDSDLDYDPICQCQDSGGRYPLVSGKYSDDGGYVAQMQRKDVKWQLTLKKIDGRWKVYDVNDQSGSVRARLERDNACVKDRKSQHQSTDTCGS
jgi:hypothetical protein